MLGDLNAEAAAAAAAELGRRRRARRSPPTSPSPEARSTLVDVALERFGRLDVLVASAGVHRDTRLDAVSPEEWDLLLAVNLRGVFLTAQAALRVLMPQRSGRIIALGSLAGQVGGLASSAAYASSKGGVIALTKSLARYCGRLRRDRQLRQPGRHRQPDDRRLAARGARPHDRRHAARPHRARSRRSPRWCSSSPRTRASFVHGAHIDVNGGILMD